MAYFAEIDTNNVVTRVVSVSNTEEYRGQEFLANDLGLGGKWIQTSYNNSFRKQYAGTGYIYDEVNDIFIVPQPFPSWKLDKNFDWQPPILQPSPFHMWDETKLQWVEIDLP